MAAPGYQLVSITNGEPDYDAFGQPIGSGAVVAFPRPPRWGRKIIKKRQDLVLETEKGRRWLYKQYDRQTYEFTFRVPPLELDEFRALDTAVDGQRDPFLFYPDTDDLSISVFVRKDPDFNEGSEQPGVLSGEIARYSDYVLIVTEEPTGTQIL